MNEGWSHLKPAQLYHTHPWHVLNEYVEFAILSLCAIVGHYSLMAEVLEELNFRLEGTDFFLHVQ